MEQLRYGSFAHGPFGNTPRGLRLPESSWHPDPERRTLRDPSVSRTTASISASAGGTHRCKDLLLGEPLAAHGAMKKLALIKYQAGLCFDDGLKPRLSPGRSGHNELHRAPEGDFLSQP
jgi:hypothetical protein